LSSYLFPMILYVSLGSIFYAAIRLFDTQSPGGYNLSVCPMR
jgi:hypothetical protein